MFIVLFSHDQPPIHYDIAMDSATSPLSHQYIIDIVEWILNGKQQRIVISWPQNPNVFTASNDSVTDETINHERANQKTQEK